MRVVTNPMLYYYFESKEGLFCKIIDHLMEHRYEQLSRIEATSQSLRDKLREFMRFSVDSALESPDILRFIYSAILGPQEGRPKYDLYAQHQKTTALVVRMFDKAVDNGEFEAQSDMNTTFLADFLLIHRYVFDAWAPAHGRPPGGGARGNSPRFWKRKLHRTILRSLFWWRRRHH